MEFINAESKWTNVMPKKLGKFLRCKVNNSFKSSAVATIIKFVNCNATSRALVNFPAFIVYECTT